MSFIHPIIVGHFGAPQSIHPGRPMCSRPIDMGHAARLIAGLPPDVARNITLRDGFVYCIWLGSGHEDQILNFALALARAEDCLVIELTQREVLFPKEKSVPLR